MGKGEEAKKTVSFVPSEGIKAKKSLAPEGFAGEGSSSAAPTAAPKKRLVVRRKSSGDAKPKS
jgi:hypothetical protein